MRLPGSSHSLPGGDRRRGAALVLSLLVLAILIVLVVQFAFSVKIEERIVKNTADDAALELAARGAEHVVAALFRDDRANGVPAGELDTLADIWCDPNTEEQRTFDVGDVQLVLVVEDLDRRFPLGWLALPDRSEWAQGVLARLIDRLAPAQGVSGEETAQIIADRVRELSDASGQAQPAPGDSGPGNRRFFGLEQLLELGDTLDRRVLYGDPELDPPTEGIAPYVTTWPVAKLNVNTMFGPVWYALLPEKNKEDQSLHEVAEEIVEAIRARRIDPDHVPSGGGEPSGESTGDQGASRSWAGTPFAKVEEVQNTEIHERLGSIFTKPDEQGGGGTPSPSPSPQPDAEGEPPALQDLLTVQSSWYMVRVKATKQSENEILEEEEEGAAPPASEFRMLLYRNPQDEVTVLYMAESPR